MSPSTWFTAARQGTAIEESTVSEAGPGGEDPVQIVNNALRLTLEHTRALTPMSMPDSGDNSEVVQVATDRKQDTEHLAPVTNVTPIGARPAPTATLHALQEWQGYVLEINETEFTARLLDVTASASFEEEEADIPLVELSDADVAKIQVGSIFRWVIGYERSVAGTKKRVSQIVLRDLPAVTKTDLQAGDAWAHRVAAVFER